MRYCISLCTVLVILAVLLSGCTSSSSQAPGSPAATQASQQSAMTTPLVTSAPAPSINGTIWRLGWFDDTKGIWSKVAEGSTVTATFGADGYITGFGGCNDYSAQYRIGTEPTIWIRRPDIGTKTCQSPLGVMSQESYYYTDISQSEDFKIIDGQLMMYDKTGRKILQFDPS
ncbi:MAG: META domain-containing protein [Methanoregula sp.]|nr:META domain-containing protein [Methanoregula sp.]